MKYTKEQLGKVGIYELRRIARNTGVASPTTKTKDTLIEEIIAIKSGAKAPVENTGRGRPIAKPVFTDRTEYGGIPDFFPHVLNAPPDNMSYGSGQDRIAVSVTYYNEDGSVDEKRSFIVKNF